MCSNLTNITIPDSVESLTDIADFAFTGCDGLEVTYKGKVYANVTVSGWKEQ